MNTISLEKKDKEHLITLLQQYFAQELDSELGQFEGEFLFDFICEKFGAHFYNQGLYDAQAMVTNRIDVVTDAIYELEKPTE